MNEQCLVGITVLSLRSLAGPREIGSGRLEVGLVGFRLADCPEPVTSPIGTGLPPDGLF